MGINRLEKSEFLPCLFVPLCLRVRLPLSTLAAIEVHNTRFPILQIFNAVTGNLSA